MSINNFIPTIWTAQILRGLKKNLIYAQPQVVNRDYEGDIQEAGNTVNIQSIGDPTISDYTKNTDMSSPETLTDATRALVIDQAKSFNFQVDDIDKAQARGGTVMAEALDRAGYKLADVTDQYIAGLAAAATTNLIGSTGTPIEVTASNAYDQMVKARIKLDVANAPTAGRWAIVPSWFAAALELDPRFIGTQGYAGNTVLMNGEIGTVAGFRVFVSNNVPNTSGAKYKVVLGCNGAITFAEQINKVEAYKPEKRFGDALKGLHLYGAKVIRPEELVVLTANDNAGLGT